MQSGGDYFEGDGLQVPDFMVEVSDSDDGLTSSDDD